MSRARSPLALLALLALLVAGTAAGARPPRLPKPARPATVTAAVPYVAPWQSGFERFSTQLITPDLVGFTLRKTVPQGQWWRIIYLSTLYSTVVAAGNRQTLLTLSDAAGNLLLQQFGPAAIPASALVVCTWAPFVTTYSNLSDLARGQETIALPDLLWPPGTQIILQIGNPQAGDGFGTQRVYAVEVYTPVKERPGVLVPLPLPV